GTRSPEDYPLTPTNPYSATKAGADLMVQAYMKTHRVPALIVRSSNNFGSYQYPEKLHGLVITNLLEGIKIPVHGNGEHLRSWLHVQDFCAALDLIMHKAEDFKIYNISGEEKSNIEVIKAIAGILDKDYSQHVEFVNDRLGPDLRYAPDHSLIEKELGWKRKYTYADSLKEVIDWYAKNRPWWQKIKKNTDFLEHYEKQRKGIYDL
ncbi:MAG: GDP-mannose 4,6-dehydratase, partial [bacterium]|nr:GDP-mannose 4,6-dehydratase [bacterium]